MSEFKQQYTDFIRSLLLNGVYNVKFRKVDGSERTMKCTLMQSFLPVTPVTEGTKRKNPDVLCVWDIENNGWRSFKLENVLSIEEN